jgi:hypothetical protein
MDVATVVGLFAVGETVETVSGDYELSVEQLRAALGYAAHVAPHLPPAVRQAPNLTPPRLRSTQISR